jgi:hypothetical protein
MLATSRCFIEQPIDAGLMRDQLSRMTRAIAESRLAISSLVSGEIGSVLAEATSAFAVAARMLLGSIASCFFLTDRWPTLADDPKLSFSRNQANRGVQLSPQAVRLCSLFSSLETSAGLRNPFLA